MPSPTPLGQTPWAAGAVLASALTPCPQNSGTNPSFGAYPMFPKFRDKLQAWHPPHVPPVGAKILLQCPPHVPTTEGGNPALSTHPESPKFGTNSSPKAHPTLAQQASDPSHLFLAVLAQGGQSPFAAATPPVGGPSWFLEFVTIWVEQPHPLRAAYIVPTMEPCVMKVSPLC